MKYTVSESMRAIDALKKMYPDSSRRTIQNWLKNGRFQHNSKVLEKENANLEPGDIIMSQDTFEKPKISKFKILYEDRYMVIIDKPVGLLSVPLDGAPPKNDALGLLRAHFGTDQIFAVHRIDRGTSGILMFARGKESEEKFDKLFETHDITREYFAIVEGRVKEDQGTWHNKLTELESYHVVESNDGKDAITHFSVIRRSPKYTYLKLRLETGRKHQIRVHCQMQGHPIVGDDRYGSTEDPLKRLCLHACTLGFIHPFTQKRVKFSSPLPPIFEVLGAKRGKLS